MGRPWIFNSQLRAPGHRHGCGTSTANSHGHRQDGIGTKARLEGARKDSGMRVGTGTEKVGVCTTSQIDGKNMAGLLRLPTPKRLSTDCYQQAAWFEWGNVKYINANIWYDYASLAACTKGTLDQPQSFCVPSRISTSNCRCFIAFLQCYVRPSYYQVPILMICNTKLGSITLSISFCLVTSIPTRAGAILSFTFWTALQTAIYSRMPSNFIYCHTVVEKLQQKY